VVEDEKVDYDLIECEKEQVLLKLCHLIGTIYFGPMIDTHFFHSYIRYIFWLYIYINFPFL